MPDLLKKYIFPLCIAVIAFVQYANTFGHDYAWDDAIVIQYNDRVQEGIGGIPSLFLNYKSPELKDKYGYRPIALSSFALDISLFGQNPQASHVVNALLYALLCVLIWFTIFKIFPEQGRLFAFVVSILFALHPLHVEVVANIKSRDEILALLFGLISLRAYLKAVQTSKWTWGALSLAAMVLAFLSKESAAFLLPIFPLSLWYQQGKSLRTGWKWYLGPFAVIGVLGGIWLLSQSLLMVDETPQMVANGTEVPPTYLGNALAYEDFPTRLANAFPLQAWNFRVFAKAEPIVHDYGTAVMPIYHWGDWEVWASMAFIIAMLVLAWKGTPARKAWSFGIWFALLTFLGFLHLVKVGPDIWADRFVFVPSLGLALFLAGAWKAIWERWGLKSIPQWVWILPLLLYGAFWGMTSFDRNAAWASTETLLEEDLPKIPNCARAHYNLGMIRYDQWHNSTGAAQKQFREECLYHYEQALKNSARAWPVYNDLGAAYMELGKPEMAYPVFAQFKEQFPGEFLPDYQLGRYHMSIDQYVEAIPWLEAAQQKAPANLSVYSLLGLSFLKLGQIERCEAIMKQGLQQAQADAAYYDLMADIWLSNGKVMEAIQYGEQALALDPANNTLLEKQENRKKYLSGNLQK